MRGSDVARLLALALIWSASFVFIRVLAPVLGPVWVATSRMLLAGGALTLAFVLFRTHLDVRRHWRAYTFIGLLNSSLRSKRALDLMAPEMSAGPPVITTTILPLRSWPAKSS